MDIPDSALAYHLSVIDDNAEELDDLPDAMRTAIFEITETARRADERDQSERFARVLELTSDLECELDLPTAVDLSAILESDIEAARLRGDEGIGEASLVDLEEITGELSIADPEDEEGVAATEGAIEALLFAMKELYRS